MAVFKVEIEFQDGTRETHYCDAPVSHEAGREILAARNFRFIHTEPMFCLILDRDTYTSTRLPWLCPCRDETGKVNARGWCPRCDAGAGEPCTQPTPPEERRKP
jgi:hypothetical protein